MNICIKNAGLLAMFIIMSCGDKKESATNSVAVSENRVEVKVIESKSSKRDSIIDFAKQYMGTPYCYAGNTPEKGFDCSGFVNFVFANFRIDLPRSSSDFKDLGTPLEPEEFRKGDILVFYGYQDSNSIGHLGIIYEANGMDSKFIHASSGSEYAVTISELNSDHYSKRFYKCIDVISP